MEEPERQLIKINKKISKQNIKVPLILDMYVLNEGLKYELIFLLSYMNCFSKN